MSFHCPACATPEALEITLALELPPDNRSDEITVQTVSCGRCGFAGLAIYEESRRGRLGAESFEHIGYRLPAAKLKRLESVMRSCPSPNDAGCDCPAHQRLGQKNTLGRWCGVSELWLYESFEMEL